MIVDFLLESSKRYANKTAVDDGLAELTYRRLTLLASVLRDVVNRETQSDRVGIMLPASSIFPAALFGTLWASKIVIPLNFLLAPDELVHVVQDSDLDLIFTIRHFEELSSKLPARTLFLEDLGLKRKTAMAMLRKTPPAPLVKGDDTAVILYTSGTTAQPKGVELTQANLHSNASDTICSIGIDSNQRILNVLPPFHVFGLTANVLVPTMLGATTYAISRFNPLAMIKTIVAKKISLMMAIPSMYAALLKSKSATAETFRSIELAMSGGEPLPESVRTGFLERFGIELHQGYGLTETSPIVAACSKEAHRVGTVGQLIRNVSVKIVDGDAKELDRGNDGEILIKGPGVMKGYYKNPEETLKVIDPDGWFHSGDIGRIDQDGYLAITGRAKEMLIIGGENVFPREIEAALETHKAVLQVAVVGMVDALRGELPVAFVTPQKGAQVTELELRNHAKQSLAGFKVPKRVIIRDDLPTGPTGKILKRQLHELL